MTDNMIERSARALAESLSRRPYGGYDYGHNEEFYGPAPKAGRYAVRCEKTDEIVHQTNDNAEHEAAWEFFTNQYHVRSVIMIIREPTSAMIEAAGELVFGTSDINPQELRIAWQAMIDAALGTSPQ